MTPADIAQAKLYFGKRYPQSRYDYDGSGNAIYVGVAPKGAQASDPAWLVLSLTYSGSNVTLIQTSPENSIWNNRAMLVYS